MEQEYSKSVILRISTTILFFLCLGFYKAQHKSEDLLTTLLLPILAYFIIISLRINTIIRFLLLFLIFFFEILESVSFYTTGSTINDQFLFNALDYKSAVKDLPKTMRLIYAAFAFLMIFTLYNNRYVIIQHRYVFLVRLFFWLFLFKKCVHVYFTLYPFRPNPFQVKDIDFLNKLNRYYNLEPSIEAPSFKKNLFIVILESFELNDLGPYNNKYPNLMPFLSKLAKSTTIFDNVRMQPFVRESIASTLCVFCNFPYVRHKSKFHRNPKFKCLPQLLQKINYTNYMMGSYNYISDNIFDFFRRRNFHILDGSIHHKYTDQEVIDWFIPNFLHKLNDIQPFVFVIYTRNTHWGEYVHLCPKEYRKYNDAPLDEFECVDIWLKKLYEALQKQKFYNQTEVIIYGDHNRAYKPTNRSEAIILPKHNWGNISKLISYYDMAHLMMHLLNITNIKPEFIFGHDPLRDDYVYRPPNFDELQYIHDSFVSTIYF